MGTLAVIALGGNALAPAGRAGTAEEQTEAIRRTMRDIADLIAGGYEVVLTHGNGPQVGNVLVKNELARDVVPPVPLDWCVAQTQATIGFTTSCALEYELRQRGIERPVVPVVSRVLVSGDDPAWETPTKPIGRYLDEEDARRRMADSGHPYAAQDERGWRRLVASPQPIESVDRRAIQLLLDAGAIVVANGGGGVPVVDRGDGPLDGIEAVIDKDLAGALLATELAAELFVILTDVRGVAVDHGTDAERWLQQVTVDQLREYEAQGHFAAGSMGPKVDAAARFVSATGGRAAIAALDDLGAAVQGRSGTQVVS